MQNSNVQNHLSSFGTCSLDWSKLNDYAQDYSQIFNYIYRLTEKCSNKSVKSVLHFSIRFNTVQPVRPHTSHASSTCTVLNAFTSYKIIHIKRFQLQSCVKKCFQWKFQNLEDGSSVCKLFNHFSMFLVPNISHALIYPVILKLSVK